MKIYFTTLVLYSSNSLVVDSHHKQARSNRHRDKRRAPVIGSAPRRPYPRFGVWRSCCLTRAPWPWNRRQSSPSCSIRSDCERNASSRTFCRPISRQLESLWTSGVILKVNYVVKWNDCNVADFLLTRYLRTSTYNRQFRQDDGASRPTNRGPRWPWRLL